MRKLNNQNWITRVWGTEIRGFVCGILPDSNYEKIKNQDIELWSWSFNDFEYTGTKIRVTEQNFHPPPTMKIKIKVKMQNCGIWVLMILNSQEPKSELCKDLPDSGKIKVKMKNCEIGDVMILNTQEQKSESSHKTLPNSLEWKKKKTKQNKVKMENWGIRFLMILNNQEPK